MSAQTKTVTVGDHSPEVVPHPRVAQRQAELFAVRQASWSVDAFAELDRRYRDAVQRLRLAVDNEQFSQLAPLRAEFVDIRDGTSRMIETLDRILDKATPKEYLR